MKPLRGANRADEPDRVSIRDAQRGRNTRHSERREHPLNGPRFHVPQLDDIVASPIPFPSREHDCAPSAATKLIDERRDTGSARSRGRRKRGSEKEDRRHSGLGSERDGKRLECIALSVGHLGGWVR
jgi:hypothetical protein